MSEYINALMICLQPINLLLIVAMVSLGIRDAAERIYQTVLEIRK